MKFLLLLFIQVVALGSELEQTIISIDSPLATVSKTLQDMLACCSGPTVNIPFSCEAVFLLEKMLAQTPPELSQEESDRLCEAANLIDFLNLPKSPIIKHVFLELLKKPSPIKHSLVPELIEPFNKFTRRVEKELKHTLTYASYDMFPYSIEINKHKVSIFRGLDRQEMKILPDSWEILSAAISRDGRYAVLNAYTTGRRIALIYDTEEKKPLKQIELSTFYPIPMAISDDGSTIAVSADEKNIHLYNRLSDQETSLTLPETIQRIALSPDGHYMGILGKAYSSTTLYIYDTQKNFTTSHQTAGFGDELAISHDGKFVVVSSMYRGSCFLYCVESNRIFNITGNRSDSHPIAISHDGKTIKFAIRREGKPVGLFYNLFLDIEELNALPLEDRKESCTEIAGATS